MKDTLAIIGALLMVLCAAPYLVDIVHRRSKPNIVTWSTWTFLLAIATAAAFASHQPQSALFTLGDFVGTGAIVVLGLKYGIAKFGWFDVFCQIGAVAGLLAWLLFKSPAIGIIVPLTIDLIAALPTYKHAWSKPAEETTQTFVIGAIGSCFTIASLPVLGSIGLLFPLYLFLSNGSIAAVIIGRKYLISK